MNRNVSGRPERVSDAMQLRWGEVPGDAGQERATDGMRDERFHLSPVPLFDEQLVLGPDVCARS